MASSFSCPSGWNEHICLFYLQVFLSLLLTSSLPRPPPPASTARGGPPCRQRMLHGLTGFQSPQEGLASPSATPEGTANTGARAHPVRPGRVRGQSTKEMLWRKGKWVKVPVGPPHRGSGCLCQSTHIANAGVRRLTRGLLANLGAQSLVCLEYDGLGGWAFLGRRWPGPSLGSDLMGAGPVGMQHGMDLGGLSWEPLTV